MKLKMLCGLLIGMLAWAGQTLGAPTTLANDHAGNYTPATFVNGANLGTGFGAWDLWNKLAELSLTIKYLPFVQKAPHGGLTCISKKRFSSGNIGGGQY